jgi:predicted transcriptional regulator
MKRKTVVLGTLGSLGLAGGGAIVKGIVEDQWETIGPVIYAIWDWMVGAYQWVAHPVAVPIWLIVGVPVTLIAVIIFLAWFARAALGGLSEGAAKLNPALSHDQLKVFMLVGFAADQGGVVTLGQVVKNERLSRNAAQHALEQLLDHNLISYSLCPGELSYELTSEGRRLYLERQRAVAA